MSELVSFFFLLLAVPLLYFGTARESTKSRNSTTVRTKRESITKYLIFPEGSNIQLVYCLTIGTYSDRPGMSTIGITAGVAWPLPDRNTAPRGNLAEVDHRRSRRELYRKVELMLKTHGKDGEACVLKAICRAANRGRADLGRGTFIQEILHAVFTYPNPQEGDALTDYDKIHLFQEDCEEFYKRCPNVF